MYLNEPLWAAVNSDGEIAATAESDKISTKKDVVEHGVKNLENRRIFCKTSKDCCCG